MPEVRHSLRHPQVPCCKVCRTACPYRLPRRMLSANSLKRLTHAFKIGSAVVAVYHRHLMSCRCRHDIDLRIVRLGKVFFQYDHGEYAGTCGHVSGAYLLRCSSLPCRCLHRLPAGKPGCLPPACRIRQAVFAPSAVSVPAFSPATSSLRQNLGKLPAKSLRLLPAYQISLPSLRCNLLSQYRSGTYRMPRRRLATFSPVSFQ